MCSFHDKFSSNKILRNAIVVTLLISLLFNFKFGREKGMLCFFPDLWNNENLLFSTFRDSFFAENHWLILIISSLTVLNNVFMLLCSKNKLYCLQTLLEQTLLKNLRDRLYATKIITILLLSLVVLRS